MLRILRCYDAAKRENRCSRLRQLLDSRWTAGREPHTIVKEQMERPGAMRPGVFYLGGKMSDAPHYRTEEEIEDVVRRFETCSYTPAEFVGKLVAELREGKGGLGPLENSGVGGGG